MEGDLGELIHRSKRRCGGATERIAARPGKPAQSFRSKVDKSLPHLPRVALEQ